jgi:hypothetical protein
MAEAEAQKRKKNSATGKSFNLRNCIFLLLLTFHAPNDIQK